MEDVGRLQGMFSRLDEGWVTGNGKGSSSVQHPDQRRGNVKSNKENKATALIHKYLFVAITILMAFLVTLTKKKGE